MSSVHNFFDRLNYLGGNLGLSPKIEEYVDLELFFLECTLNFSRDTRTRMTILNWLCRYAQILSPSKIRRLIIKEGLKYCEKGLYVLLTFLRENSLVGQNWSILEVLSERGSGNDFRVPKNFRPNFDKYLKTASFVLENCPEVYWRAHGSHQVAADLKAYLIKHQNYKSLYELAKKIHSPRGRVNEFIYSFKKLGVSIQSH